MSTKDFIGFTIDCKALGNLLAQDPTSLNELIEGINAAARGESVPTTSKLGAANLGGDGDEADWHGLFVSTVKDVSPGTPGLFYRNNTRGGKGDRIQMRLRRQKKSQVAQTPGQVLTPEQQAAVNQIAANPAMLQAIVAAQQAQVAQVVQPQPQTGLSVAALQAAAAAKLA